MHNFTLSTDRISLNVFFHVVSTELCLTQDWCLFDQGGPTLPGAHESWSGVILVPGICPCSVSATELHSLDSGTKAVFIH